MMKMTYTITKNGDLSEVGTAISGMIEHVLGPQFRKRRGALPAAVHVEIEILKRPVNAIPQGSRMSEAGKRKVKAATEAVELIRETKPGDGKTLNALVGEVVKSKRGPGRPKGSRNKSKKDPMVEMGSKS